MNRILFFASILALATSCGNVHTIKVDQVDHLFIDYDRDTPNNYGTYFDAQIAAQMKTGEILYLKDNSDFVCSYNVICHVKDKKMAVLGVPQVFDASEVPVLLKMGNKQGDTIRSTDTLRLNFNAGPQIGSYPRNGANGKDGSNGSTSILFRDGKSGDNGNNGANGLTGDSYEIHIWKEADVYYIHVLNQVTGLIGKYQVHGTKPFHISASGSNGGDGGDGGSGGDGKDGQTGDKPKYPGDGGNGGSGGSGGQGGDGGTIRCILHPSAEDFRGSVKMISAGGRGGQGGKGGNGGKGGAAVGNQTGSKNGASGSNGWNGLAGRPGTTAIVVEDFSPQAFR